MSEIYKDIQNALQGVNDPETGKTSALDDESLKSAIYLLIDREMEQSARPLVEVIDELIDFQNRVLVASSRQYVEQIKQMQEVVKENNRKAAAIEAVLEEMTENAENDEIKTNLYQLKVTNAGGKQALIIPDEWQKEPEKAPGIFVKKEVVITYNLLKDKLRECAEGVEGYDPAFREMIKLAPRSRVFKVSLLK